MKKIILLLFVGIIVNFTYGQKIEGSIATDHRKMLNHFSDTINGHINASYTIQFSVNEKGAVTSTQIIGEKTKTPSSIARIRAMDVVRKFKFEPGTWFPKYHQGKVTIYMVTSKK